MQDKLMNYIYCDIQAGGADFIQAMIEANEAEQNNEQGHGRGKGKNKKRCWGLHDYITGNVGIFPMTRHKEANNGHTRQGHE